MNIIAALCFDSVILASILFAVFNVTMLPSWIFFLGISLMIAGVIIRQWAVAILGGYFSHVIGVQKDQRVVQTGPYRFIRHPSYTGILLLLVGMALVFQTWGAVLVTGLSFGLAYGYRMLYEEKFLTKELGSSYAEYMKRTKRIIPFLI